MLQNKHISVLIPAFNEEKSIAQVIKELPKDVVDDIVVVDNGSTDATREIALLNGARVVTESSRGYGSACLKGIASIDSTDIVVIIDGDHSDYPEQITRLLEPIVNDKYDFVIGSRVLGKREDGALSPQAYWGNKLAVFLIDRLFGYKFTDMGPFRAIRFESLMRLKMRDRNFGWNVEMQIKAIKGGLKILEVPVDYRRRIGVSKISGTVSGTIKAGVKILFTIFKYYFCKKKKLKIAIAIGSFGLIILLMSYTNPHKLYTKNSNKVKGDSGLSIEKINARRLELGSKYKPRTRHLTKEGWAKYTNRLFLESSPYLLQHAHNPVNWYPWGNEAFEYAKKYKRPILLSIGYSTCHWCHVMEEESFEDEEIAKEINENYIAIKVDREERPDIDAIYMSAVQTMTGSGGWPMTLWLTNDKKPFYGGTYYPARDGDRGAGVGFLTLLKRLRKLYDEKPDKVSISSQEIANIIEKNLAPNKGTTLPKSDILHNLATYYNKRFDSSYGGLIGSPKFPSSLPVRFLLRYYRRTGDKDILKAITISLEKMSSGGMYDHVGGGFHRYSTDEKWLVPHFEKMLYDNALLAIVYLEAYQVTGNLEFKRITREILRYVKRDMTSPQGAFYSATDADSLSPSGYHEEGWFFTWTPREIEDVLGKNNLKFIKKYYSVTSHGNFERRNILNTPLSLPNVAKKYKLPQSEAKRIVTDSLDKLYHSRLERSSPIRDEKILTSWNGLMISAYAKAGLLLNENEYITIAKSCANFILNNLFKKERLLRSFKDGQANLNAYLDDYAFFISALIDLYEATSEISWLAHAIKLDGILENYYEDKKGGGFFMISHDHEKLLAREKPSYDGAEPSGNSIAILNLLRLHEFTTTDRYRVRAENAIKAFSGIMQSNPAALPEMILAVDYILDKPKEIIIVSPKGKKSDSEMLLSQFRKKFIPNRVVSFIEEGDELQAHSELIPIVKSKYSIDGKPTAYVCEEGSCLLPTNDSNLFYKQISETYPYKDKP